MDGKICVIRNFLTEEECFDFIVTYKNKVRRAGFINNEFSYERRSKVFIWKNDSVLENKFNSHDMVFQFSEYSKLNYYHWHNDFNTSQSDRKRIETCVVPLNKEYQGGLFEIENQDPIELNVGDCLIFDSKLEHRVKPVLKGKRYSLTAWNVEQKTMKHYFEDKIVNHLMIANDLELI